MFVVALALTLSLPPARPNEPTYSGRPLSFWTAGLAPGPSDGSTWDECREAIRQIGTNSLPFLLEWIQFPPAIDSGISIDVNDPKNRLAYGSAHAFEVLGSSAAAAVPELARLANSSAAQNNRYLFVQALAGIGPAGLPALLTVVTNPGNNARVFAISAIENLGTNAEPALPTLLALLRDPEPDVVAFAASALGNLRLQPQLVVPALQRLLQGESTTPCRFAINALAQFGPDARTAVPDLARFLNDPSEHMRGSATYALRKIAPKTLTNSPSR
jgi:hypothetical protein